MKKKIFTIFSVLFFSYIYSQYRELGTAGEITGDGAKDIGVKVLTNFDFGGSEWTKFELTNYGNDILEVQLNTVVQYTCMRSKSGLTAPLGAKTFYLKPGQTKESNAYILATNDKKCVNESDGMKTTYLNSGYTGKIVKNHSADERKKEQEFQTLMNNVNNYYSQKKYALAETELNKASKIAVNSDDAQAVQEWYRKISEAKENDAAKTKDVNNENSTKSNNKSGGTKSSSDDFWNDTPSSKSASGTTATRTETAAEKKARQDKEVTDKVNKIVADGERQRVESQRKMDAWSNNLNTTFYAQQSAKSAYDNVKQNSNLTGNYSSIEELEADFNQKYYSVNQNVNEWKESADESVRQGANLLFNDGTASGQTIGELAGMVGTLFNNGEKEKREARERLEKQKQQYLAEFAAKKKAALKDLRTKLIAEFPDGGTPLSKHNITQPEVYCFAYYFNQNNIGADNPEIYITNVFPVAQYSDGTWPFKNSLVNEMKTKTKAPQITLMGYYTQKDLADKMRQSLINLSGKAEMKATALEYKGKAANKNSKASSDDFWETGKTETKKETTKTKSDDFWNN